MRGRTMRKQRKEKKRKAIPFQPGKPPKGFVLTGDDAYDADRMAGYAVDEMGPEEYERECNERD